MQTSEQSIWETVAPASGFVRKRNIMGAHGEQTNTFDASQHDLEFNKRLAAFYATVNRAAAEGLELVKWLMEENGVSTGADLPATVIEGVYPILHQVNAARHNIPTRWTQQQP